MEVATRFFGLQRGPGYYPHHFLYSLLGTFESPILGLSVKPLKEGHGRSQLAGIEGVLSSLQRCCRCFTTEMVESSGAALFGLIEVEMCHDGFMGVLATVASLSFNSL